MYHDAVPQWAGAGKYQATNVYLSEWKANQTLGMNATLKSVDGWFNPACFIHTGFTSTGPVIGGKSYYDVFDTWLQGLSTGGNAPRVMDDCGILCGHHCTTFRL